MTYCKEMSVQIYEKVHQLYHFLEGVKSNNFFEQEIYEHNSKKLISTLIENYENIIQITSRQKKVLALLLNLKVELEHINVNTSEGEANLWNWIEMRLEYNNCTCRYTSTPEMESHLSKAIDYTQKFKKILRSNYIQKKCCGKIFNFLFNDTLGSLDYMRSDLFKRFRCEEYNIDTKNARINSVFVCTELASCSAVIICNPNAGFYEFTYFQSEWLEFYLSRDINVILWNYRGYGRSHGTPTIKDIIEDGKIIIDYFVKIKNIQKLAVHGESLGGCIGILLAEAVNCDFLLADRTFGSLSDMILFTYGKFAYWVYKLLRVEDVEIASKFLMLNCYKVIASDPNDKVIPNLASLKVAVAASLLIKNNMTIGRYFLSKKWVNDEHILSINELKKLANSLDSIKKKIQLQSIEDNYSKYKHVLKTESNEDIEKKEVIRKIIGIFRSIDSCGLLLIDVMQPKLTEFNLKFWIMSLEIWGSFFGILVTNETNPLYKSLKDVKNGVLELKCIDKNEVSDEIDIVSELFARILEYLQETTNRTVNSFRTDENINSTDYSKAGNFLWIECGHGGQYSQVERCNYEHHLIQAGFL